MKPELVIVDLDLARRWRVMTGGDRIPIVSATPLPAVRPCGCVGAVYLIDLVRMRQDHAMAVMDWARRRASVTPSVLARAAAVLGGLGMPAGPHVRLADAEPWAVDRAQDWAVEGMPAFAFHPAEAGWPRVGGGSHGA